MKIHIIVQARMGSTRLPGKILMPIMGKPMLLYLLERLNFSRLAQKIIIATTLNPKDDPVEEFCRDKNVEFYRGSENDVLDRYYQAAKKYASDVVVRITADCPLIDPVVIDKVISEYLDKSDKFDGASNVIKRTYPRGLDTEVLGLSVLTKAWEEARDPQEREHVTQYVYKHPELFRMVSVENITDLSHLRWTVDEKSDFQFVKEVYEHIGSGERISSMDDIVIFLKKYPFLLDINKEVKQK